MSRIKQTILNARVNLIFYSLTLLLGFFSRKIFIETLGTTFLGLTSTIPNLLGFLNLTELGLGTAITYLLFQPLLVNDKDQIIKILTILKRYYKKTGLYIIFGGVILSAFFPIIFKDSTINLYVIYGTFFSYLFISFTSYYFNYLQLLLLADQKNYVKISLEGSLNIVKVVLQIIIVLYFTEKIIFYLLTEILFSINMVFLINKKIKKIYPWIPQNLTSVLDSEISRDVKVKTKQIFSHQVAGYILSQTDQLLIFSFTSLNMVTYFTNYTLLLGRIISLIDQFLNSSHASIGNLIASKNKIHIKNIYDELMVLRYWIGGSIIFISYHFVPPIIELWLGNKFLLDSKIFILMLINNYIMITRRPVDSFLSTSGIFNDTWAPWTEAMINLTTSVFAGYYYGISGILFGTLISSVIIVVIWKPYLLYSVGFKISVKNHWKNVSFYILSFGFSFFLVTKIGNLFELNFLKEAYLNLMIKILFYGLSFSLFYFMLLFIFHKSMRTLTIKLIPFLSRLFS